ncbi:MAG: hypothetical protein M0R34_11480 [Candidatus Marinimicrobia bacterium]|jgi:hypothetical protein|nr:hypothetical protein [Candidatus Neomarinimicrobiota bacterium]MCK9558870.1 hypothetical protein [Candidatus Neomarinimicrobiota bacterium]MDD5062928.1 hypothetical protein [Candidatus Neomarinimicrobiota bacterium]
MCQKIASCVFYYAGILSLVLGILEKLFGFMLFDLKPSRFLMFAAVCAIYTIASVLYKPVCEKKE